MGKITLRYGKHKTQQKEVSIASKEIQQLLKIIPISIVKEKRIIEFCQEVVLDIQINILFFQSDKTLSQSLSKLPKNYPLAL